LTKSHFVIFTIVTKPPSFLLITGLPSSLLSTGRMLSPSQGIQESSSKHLKGHPNEKRKRFEIYLKKR